MKALAFGCALLVAVVASARAQGDGGGKDVSVVMFSTHTLHGVSVMPTGERAWTASCSGCAHRPLTAATKFQRGEMFAGGALRVTDDATGEARSAAGLWHLRSTSGGEIDVVLTLPSERYVAMVLQAEVAGDEPTESLYAMAILVRTYALNGPHYTSQRGHLSADLCDSTQCQAMAAGAASSSMEEAVRATAGETLWSEKHRAQVFFSQSCGGVTEDVRAVWPGREGASCLKSHADPYCLRRDAAIWHAEVPLDRLRQVAEGEGWRVPDRIVSVRVAERSVSHRALRVVFTGATGHTAAISATALRFGIGRALGWNLVRSDAYDLAVRNGALVFDGHGHGHGVGLCQLGAREMATEHKKMREILAFYFPGAEVRITPLDEGWHDERTGTLRFRFTEERTLKEGVRAEQLWVEAQRRFVPLQPITPQIVFAPTTEVFRQLTGQPGWMLASTSRDTIVLQPEAVLRAHDADGTILHEMLHVLVEASASAATPLWLREGLVEVLAGSAKGDAPSMSMSAISDELAHPDSVTMSRRAHEAAGAEVKALVARYGMSVVRSWLALGVPARLT